MASCGQIGPADGQTGHRTSGHSKCVKKDTKFGFFGLKVKTKPRQFDQGLGTCAQQQSVKVRLKWERGCLAKAVESPVTGSWSQIVSTRSTTQIRTSAKPCGREMWQWQVSKGFSRLYGYADDEGQGNHPPFPERMTDCLEQFIKHELCTSTSSFSKASLPGLNESTGY